jgi:hypothetical protein
VRRLVVLTKFNRLKSAFAAVSVLMVISAFLQLSLVSSREWASIFGKVDHLKRSMSFSMPRESNKNKYQRSQSTPASMIRSWLDDNDVAPKKFQ